MISDDLLKHMCSEAGIPSGIYQSDRFFFTLKQVNNFYYDGKITVEAIGEGFVDSSGDGGIDFILIKNEQLILVQGKTGHLEKNEIRDVFEKIKLTISKIEANDLRKLKRDMVSNFLNMRGNLQDPDNIKLVLFSKEEISDELQKEFESYKRYNRKYSVEIFDQSEIEDRRDELYTNTKVESGIIAIDSEKNVLKYDRGAIVNISANSLKTICVQNSKKGLFSFNLRGKISGARVDNNIKNTIDSEPKEFWYRNNGITIGCEDFDIHNNTVELEKFSIINGAQTTTNIVDSDSVTIDNDFYLVCKIIKTPDNINMEAAKDYLQKISVASNSQKPITPQDIRANDKLQVSLRNAALSSFLPFEIAIKRPIEYEVNKFESWRQIDNSVLGQLIFSCICQNPGLAKSSKSKILDSDELYDYVYNRNHNVVHYFDILILYKKFNEYKADQRKIINSLPEEEKDEETINQFYICKEGILAVLAVIYKLLSIRKLKDKSSDYDGSSDDSKKEINFANRIFNINTIGEISPSINDLFSYIIETISSIYNSVHVELGLSNQAYFLKNNTNYEKYIVKKFVELYHQKYTGKTLRELLSEIFDLS